MSPKTRQTITVAAVAVAVAAIAGIAAIEGWISLTVPGEAARPAPAPPRVAATAPPESLSPGESVVEEARRDPPKPPAPEPPPPGEAKPPAAKPPEPATPERGTAPQKPQPKTPAYAQARPPKPAPGDKSAPRCTNCGVIASTTFHEDDPYAPPWEVRVTFDDGRRRVMRFPTDPGFRVGDRVFLSQGRLRRG